VRRRRSKIFSFGSTEAFVGDDGNLARINDRESRRRAVTAPFREGAHSKLCFGEHALMCAYLRVRRESGSQEGKWSQTDTSAPRSIRCSAS
jgi:hypothetical protein